MGHWAHLLNARETRLRADMFQALSIDGLNNSPYGAGAEAAADVFLTALKALPKGERAAVVVWIARDKAFARDIRDLALIADRRREPSRPFREYLSQKNR